jgi:branched-chain amino acid transport system ATP-binding protein
MPLLEASGISKRFGGIVALQELSLSVEQGEAVGLVGPNGAGKTTLFNCLLGVTRPDTGTVRFDGHDISRMPTYRRARLGIARTFQRVELFTEMTPREHFLIADRARKGNGALWKDLLNRGAPAVDEHEHAAEVVALLGIGDVADLPVEALSLGHARLVELGRALVTQPRLLLLDEPSSGLDRMESVALAQTLARVQKDRETAILLVEHDLEMVQMVVSRLNVLDFGELIASGPTAEVLADAQVRRAYLGQDPREQVR